MLQIKDIRKQYITGELVQTALDGVSLTLRDNEFVAILGPSGSGKTTLLNVIGGLDRYDSGDLIINGISTKKYTDRDWDSYRNHTIGFVFQSYNLIPHQTVLQNVELALTISGISPSERKRRAKEALEAVGLGNQLHKRPNQMSGGQMQRVAIARALVNDPDILLADEPTGALDTQTSIQVMDLLKEVSRDKLVVMVTHNPELAEQYANRIVRVKDGRIIGDSNPYDVDTESLAPPRHENMGKSSMSFWTALTLSFNNLWTKKARTLLTAFAGSIGIIGIALIMSLSTGFQRYIDKIQEDTLSNYPLTIQSETADMTAALAAMGSAAAQAEEAEEGTVVEQQMISQMFAQVGSNDLASFKAHLDENMDQIADTLNAIQFGYGIKPNIYLADTSKGVTQVNPTKLFNNLTGSSAMSAYMDSDIFYEMMDNIALLDAQYDVLRGHWPENWNEMVLVLTDPNQISDYVTYSLGLRDAKELEKMISQVMAGQEPGELNVEPMQLTYEELMALEFRLVSASSKYRYNAGYEVWEDMSDSESYMQELVRQGEELKIVGIVAPKEGVSTTALTSGIAYTSDLTQHVIDTAAESDIVQRQLEDKTVDVFTGTPFGEESEEEGLNFQEMISVDTDALSSAFGMDFSTDAIASLMENYITNALGSITVDTQGAQADFVDGLTRLGTNMLHSYIAQNAGATGTAVLGLSDGEAMASAYLATGDAAAIIGPMASQYQVSEDTFKQVYEPLLSAMVSCYVASEIAGSDQLLPESPETAEPTESTQPTEDAEATEAEAQAQEAVVLTAQAVETTEPVTEPSAETAAPTEATESTEAEENTEATETTESTQPSLPEIELPESTLPEIEIGPEDLTAVIGPGDVSGFVSEYASSTVVTGVAGVMGGKMMMATVYDNLKSQISGLGNVLMSYVGSSFYVDESKFAEAFQFNMDEEELKRLMEAMASPSQEASADGNLRALGYADQGSPTGISIYFVDFAGKEKFLAFLDGYNADMEAAGKEDQVIGYADVTGIMMSSVRTIIDSVSYALIAFVAVSLVVSSIMIGIITYISVMERTKEIGVLRAIGASKRNISQVFNAETFIIGLCSGLIGVGITLLLLIPGNQLIYHLTQNPDIVAQLPVVNAVALTGLSMVLTLIGGFIPAKQAAKKDPVIALRSE